MKGIYILKIHVDREIKITIGALGPFVFEKGTYFYVGSAQNNLEKRIKRHLSGDKKIRWHIDYLLQYAKVVNVYYQEADKSQECRTARLLANKGKAVKGFGASDCSCTSHLFQASNLHPTAYGFREWEL